jgi:hypothetical protein
MPTTFRRSVPRGVGFRRPRRNTVISAPPIRPAVFAMAGTSTVPGVGASRVSAVFSAAGIAALSATGRAIKPTVLSAAGVGTMATVGQPFATGHFSMAGVAAAAFAKGLGQITSTGVIQKPVDYFLAGDKKSKRGERASVDVLRSIFRE